MDREDSEFSCGSPGGSGEGGEGDGHLEVEAQQVGDDPRHGGQDDHLGDVVEQRVHGQPVEPEGDVQLLETAEGTRLSRRGQEEGGRKGEGGVP